MASSLCISIKSRICYERIQLHPLQIRRVVSSGSSLEEKGGEGKVNTLLKKLRSAVLNGICGGKGDLRCGTVGGGNPVPLGVNEEGSSKAKGDNPNRKSACLEAINGSPSLRLGVWANNPHPLNPIIKESEVKPDGHYVGNFQHKTEKQTGFWNVRTLMESGKVKQVAKQMDQYTLE
jgi:hypothetical protein